MTSTYVPNRDLWCEFIRAYQELPELWKSDHPLFKDKKNRMKSLNKLLDEYKKLDPTATILTLKNRINTFRSVFRREQKKIIKSINESVTLDQVYVPTLWYYDELSFLAEEYNPQPKFLVDQEEVCDPLLSPINQLKKAELDTKPDADLTDRESDNYSDKDAQSDSVSEPLRTPELLKRRTKSVGLQDQKCDPDFEPATEIVKKKRKRKRISVGLRKSARRSLSPTQSFIGETTPQDDAAIFAASWAASYRKLTAMQQIFAKKAIEEILVLGRLDKLSFETVNMTVVTGAPTTRDNLPVKHN